MKHKKSQSKNWFMRNIDFILLIPIIYGFIGTILIKSLPSIWFGTRYSTFTWILLIATIVGIVLMITRAIRYKNLRILRWILAIGSSAWILAIGSSAWILFVFIAIKSLSGFS